MSLSADKWEGEHEGHVVRVVRSNVTRGFEARIDGQRVGGKLFTLVGVGEATGVYHIEGREVPVKIEVSAGNDCNVFVDGKWVRMKQVE
jgi:hypothetical protein